MKVSRGLAPGRTQVKATTKEWLYGLLRGHSVAIRLLPATVAAIGLPPGPRRDLGFTGCTPGWLLVFHEPGRLQRPAENPPALPATAAAVTAGVQPLARRGRRLSKGSHREPPAPAGYRRYGRILGQTNMSARCFGEGWLSENWRWLSLANTHARIFRHLVVLPRGPRALGIRVLDGLLGPASEGVGWSFCGLFVHESPLQRPYPAQNPWLEGVWRGEPACKPDSVGASPPRRPSLWDTPLPLRLVRPTRD